MMTRSTNRSLLKVAFVVFAMSLGALHAKSVPAADGDTFGLVEVRVNRINTFFGPSPQDKVLSKTGQEVIKGYPEKIELNVSREWYAHDTSVAVEAPRTVTEGKSVTLKATAESTWDFKLKQPSTGDLKYALWNKIGLESEEFKTVTASAEKPIRSGKHSLTAESTVNVTVTSGGGTFGRVGAADERQFTVDVRSSVAGSQANIVMTWIYRRDAPGFAPPKPGGPETANTPTTGGEHPPKPGSNTGGEHPPTAPGKCPQTLERNWVSNWGEMPIRVHGNTASGSYTKSRASFGPGTFSGTINGRVLEARWRDNDGRTEGTFRITLSEDGCRFQGSNTTVSPPTGRVDHPQGQDPSHAGGSGAGSAGTGSAGTGSAGTGSAGDGHQGNPWETVRGQGCFEEWITVATRLLNQWDGGSGYNDRKPWSFNQYGLRVGKGVTSAYAPDDFAAHGNNRYWWMWDHYDTDPFGRFINEPQLNAAGVPSLRDYVRRCAPDTPLPIGPNAGLILRAPHLIVPRGSVVLVPVELLNARDVLNLDFDLNYIPEIASARSTAERGSLVTQISEYNLLQPGLYKFNFAQLSPINGNGTVAGFRFDATGPGRSRTPLSLSVHTINNSAGTSLPITTIDGSITIWDRDDGGDPNNPANANPPGGTRLEPTCSGSGRQTVNDAQCCLKMWVGLTPRSMQMDVDDSGEVDSRDAVIVLQNVLRGLGQ